MQCKCKYDNVVAWIMNFLYSSANYSVWIWYVVPLFNMTSRRVLKYMRSYTSFTKFATKRPCSSINLSCRTGRVFSEYERKQNVEGQVPFC